MKRIAEEILYEESLFLSGFRMMSCKGMPPPVVAFLRLMPEELTLVSRYIVLVEHGLNDFIEILQKSYCS